MADSRVMKLYMAIDEMSIEDLDGFKNSCDENWIFDIYLFKLDWIRFKMVIEKEVANKIKRIKSHIRDRSKRKICTNNCENLLKIDS